MPETRRQKIFIRLGLVKKMVVIFPHIEDNFVR